MQNVAMLHTHIYFVIDVMHIFLPLFDSFNFMRESEIHMNSLLYSNDVTYKFLLFVFFSNMLIWHVICAGFLYCTCI